MTVCWLVGWYVGGRIFLKVWRHLSETLDGEITKSRRRRDEVVPARGGTHKLRRLRRKLIILKDTGQNLTEYFFGPKTSLRHAVTKDKCNGFDTKP